MLLGLLRSLGLDAVARAPPAGETLLAWRHSSGANEPFQPSIFESVLEHAVPLNEAESRAFHTARWPSTATLGSPTACTA